MTVTARPIVQSKEAEAADTTQYTAPAGVRCILDRFTACNTSGSQRTLTVRLVPADGAPGAANQAAAKVLQPGEAYTFPEVVGHVLAAGDFISTLASGAGVAIRASGREVA